jgi:uncharacterized protein
MVKMLDEQCWQNDGPVTVIITHRAKKGLENKFRSWLKNINAEAMKFSGFMGVQVIEPFSKINLEYVIIVRFDSYQNLRHWNDSNIRKKYLDEITHLTSSEAKHEYLGGLEYCFTLPQSIPRALPKKHKMAFVTWLAITPLLLIIPPGLEPIMILIGVFSPYNVLFSALILVLLMTYCVMPLMTPLFGKWLFKK